MQKEVGMSGVAKAYKSVLFILAWLFLCASWFSLVIAFRDFFIAVQNYGILDARTFLDAGLGYFGLLSFGLSSMAVIFSVKADCKSNQILFRLFKLTFFVSIFFLASMLFSIVVFLLS